MKININLEQEAKDLEFTYKQNARRKRQERQEKKGGRK